MNLADELKKLTSGITETVTGQAKDTAIQTLNDPEFRASINDFTRNWFKENELVLTAIVASFVMLAVMGIANILFFYRKG